MTLAAETTLDAAALRRTFGLFPSGVTAVCALIDGRPVGMAASSFTSVSIDPPLVSVCVADSSATWRALRGAARIGVTVLGADQAAASGQLAARAADDRFSGLGWVASPDGAVHLEGGAAWFDCSLEGEVPAGDHHIALLRIHAVGADPATPPLVFHQSRYRFLQSDDVPGLVA